jgi:dynein heavy chain
VFPELGDRDDLTVPCGGLADETVSMTKDTIREIVQANSSGPAQYLAQYDEFKHLLGTPVEVGEEEAKVIAFVSQQQPLPAYVQYIERLEALSARILNLRDTAPLGLFTVDATRAHAQLRLECDRLKAMLVASVVAMNRKLNRSICERFDETANRLMEVPPDTEDMTQLDEYLQVVKSDTIFKLKVAILALLSRQPITNKLGFRMRSPMLVSVFDS